MSTLSGLAVAVRIARRDALRHRGRSVLVLLMIALPVLGLTAADVLARTMQLSPVEKVDREIGSADAMLQVVGGRVTQNPDPARGLSADGTVEPGTHAFASAERAARDALPPGSRVLGFVRDTALVAANGRAARVDAIEVNLTDRMTAGLAHVDSGRPARAAHEVALSPHLADRLGASVGSVVRVGGAPATVTGLVTDPSGLGNDVVWAVPGGVRTDRQGATATLLAATPRPLTWTDVRRMNAIGVAVTSRYVVTHPPPRDPSMPGSGSRVNPATVGVAIVAVGLAVLEVVLLAGAAFAVGARRQRRELALVAAAGGDAGDVRRIVLASGGVLGAAGAVLGVVLGIGTGIAGLPTTQRLTDGLGGHVDIRPWELAGVAVLGLGTGLLAAALPARTAARDDVVAALTGRRGIVVTARRVPAAGVTMIVVGALVAGYAAHPPARFGLVLVGAVLSELGFVVCAPAVVGLIGRGARFLPLAPRLALRDAARHRSRTGPAAAAIMAAIAGGVAVSTYIVSTVAKERAQYEPQALTGQAIVRVLDTAAVGDRQALLAAVRRDLGAAAVVAVPTTDCVNGDCAIATLSQQAASCATGATCASGNVVPAVGDARLVAALAGRSDPGVAAALARGDVVVLADGLVRDGRVAVHVTPGGDSPRPVDRAVRAYRVGTAAGTPVVPAVMSQRTARALGATWAVRQYVTAARRPPSSGAVDRANAELGDVASVYVERGYHPQRWAYGLVALAIGAAIVTLGATAITTALSSAESRPDLVTLAAVGAAPRTRRALAGSQAGVVTTLGAVLGVVAGVIPAWAILTANGAMPFVLPWPTIGALVVGLPVLATLTTAAVSRAPLAAERRLG